MICVSSHKSVLLIHASNLDIHITLRSYHPLQFITSTLNIRLTFQYLPLCLPQPGLRNVAIKSGQRSRWYRWEATIRVLVAGPQYPPYSVPPPPLHPLTPANKSILQSRLHPQYMSPLGRSRHACKLVQCEM